MRWTFGAPASSCTSCSSAKLHSRQLRSRKLMKRYLKRTSTFLTTSRTSRPKIFFEKSW
jgi:hypothetical protein